MLRGAALVLVPLLLAGCVEEPPAPAAGAAVVTPDLLDIVPTLPVPSPDDPAPSTPTPPVPTVTPTAPTVPPKTPPEEPRVLHRNARHASADPQPVSVPADIERVQLVVEANGSWSGRVTLLYPDGTLAISCPDACGNFQSATPGRWALDFTDDVPGEVAVTVYGHPYPSTNPRVPPNHVYLTRYHFNGPTTNYTDFIAVVPGHEELRGFLWVDAPDTDDSLPAGITLTDPKGVDVVSCITLECPVSVREPAPGLWRVWYAHGGNGSGGADLSLLGEGIRPTSMYAYLHDHAYASHPGRAPFQEGFGVPVGVKLLRFGVSFQPVGPGEPDPDATALVELRAPDRSVRATCGRATTGSGCLVELDDVPQGGWSVHYLGADARSYASVFVKIE